MNQRSLIGSLLIIASMVIWGSSGMVVRTVTAEGIRSIDVLQIECIAVTLFLGAYLFIKDRNKLKIRLRDVWCFCGTGILNMMAHSLCYFYGIQVASLAVIGAIMQLGPVIAILLGHLLFREKITRFRIISMTLTFVGCILATGLSGNERLTGLGLLLGLGTAVSYSMYSIFGRFAIDRGYNSLTITFYSFVACGIACIPFTDWNIVISTVTGSTKTLFRIVFELGLIVGCAGYVLYTKGLERVDTGCAAILGSLELVVATLIGVFVYHEELNIVLALGLALIIAGICVLSRDSSNELQDSSHHSNDSSET